MVDRSLIQKMWITEKAALLAGMGKYVFMVKPGSTKNEVKKAVKSVYSVDPVSVEIIRMPAKKRGRGRVSGTKPSYKKAIVTLKSGQSISYE